jgi:CheY-like chemotaxis protein
MSVPHYTTGVRPTILIVDDYADALPAWELFLRAEGFDVLTAEDGPCALSCATSVLPDLVVMDLELPGLSGCQVAEALRARTDTKHIPLIAATGFSQSDTLDRARRSGFDSVLVKPCDPTALIAEIRRLLGSTASSRRSPPEH